MTGSDVSHILLSASIKNCAVECSGAVSAFARGGQWAQPRLGVHSIVPISKFGIWTLQKLFFLCIVGKKKKLKLGTFSVEVS